MSQATLTTRKSIRGAVGGRQPLAVLGLILILLATFAAGSVLRSATTSAPQARAPRPAVTTDAIIQSLQVRLTKNPADVQAAVELGSAYLQKVRETGDPTWYSKADAVLRDALAREPQNAEAMASMGALQLSLHNFRDGLDWGLKARTAEPRALSAYPVLIDGYVELGQYEQAVVAADEFASLKPSLASYTRVSYLRELYGDREGAIQAMRLALDTAPMGSEPWAWTRVQLGNLYSGGGNLDAAEREYAATLQALPDYAPALAGLGRVAAARGAYQSAIELLSQAAARIPLPEYVIPLGEAYLAAGDTAAADQQFALVRAEMQLLAASGQNVDLEFALFLADHPAAGESSARLVATARAALADRPGIYGHDTLAWALYQAGQFQEAQREIEAALRLDTRDAMLYFHAGMIARALGDEPLARRHLQTALRINPYFSILHAQTARDVLHELGMP